MPNPHYFSKLVESAERIARHAYFPGKDEALDQCMEDVEELSRIGRITTAQCDRLLEILTGCPRMACQPALSA